MTTPSTASSPSIRLALLSAELFQTTSPTARASLAHECYAPNVIAYSGLGSTATVYHGLEEVLGWAASLLDKNDKGESPPNFELKAVAVGECWDLVSLEWELRWLNDAGGEGEGKYKGEVLRGQDVCQFEEGSEKGAGGKIVRAWTVVISGRE